MKIHEYQAKAILARHGVPVPRGEVAFTAAEAGEIARRLGGAVVVVKAQIHAGGRGKGGGVKLAKIGRRMPSSSPRDMIGMTLVTHQTGPEGRVVGARARSRKGCRCTRELYLSIVLDRAAGKPVMMASAAGGMDIEEVAAKTPEKIVRVYIEPGVGIVPFEARQLGLRASASTARRSTSSSSWSRRSTTRSSPPTRRCVEINPLVVTAGGRSAGARRQDELRRQRALPASRHHASCATSARRIRSRSKRRSSR